MGGFFGVASKENCIFDLFFGTDYHSHLGTRRAGMALYDAEAGFNRAIHNIENTPFRTKFDKDVNKMYGTLGIGCISDFEPQPLIIRSHHGTYAITTVGRINNKDEIVSEIFQNGKGHFLEMSGGDINATELVAAVINQRDNLIEGIQYAQELIDGSMTILIMTPKGIYAARDRMGRTPVTIGKKDDACCVSFESFAYLNLGYVFVDLLWLSFLLLRGDQCGGDALSLWGDVSEARRREAGYRGGCAGFGHSTCHRLRQRVGDPVFQTVHQVYAHVAPFLHAHDPEQAESDRKDETDPGA